MTRILRNPAITNTAPAVGTPMGSDTARGSESLLLLVLLWLALPRPLAAGSEGSPSLAAGACGKGNPQSNHSLQLQRVAVPRRTADRRANSTAHLEVPPGRGPQAGGRAGGGKAAWAPCLARHGHRRSMDASSHSAQRRLHGKGVATGVERLADRQSRSGSRRPSHSVLDDWHPIREQVELRVSDRRGAHRAGNCACCAVETGCCHPIAGSDMPRALVAASHIAAKSQPRRGRRPGCSLRLATKCPIRLWCWPCLALSTAGAMMETFA